jgi:hypothetical protein
MPLPPWDAVACIKGRNESSLATAIFSPSRAPTQSITVGADILKKRRCQLPARMVGAWWPAAAFPLRLAAAPLLGGAAPAGAGAAPVQGLLREYACARGGAGVVKYAFVSDAPLPLPAGARIVNFRVRADGVLEVHAAAAAGG